MVVNFANFRDRKFEVDPQRTTSCNISSDRCLYNHRHRSQKGERLFKYLPNDILANISSSFPLSGCHIYAYDISLLEGEHPSCSCGADRRRVTPPCRPWPGTPGTPHCPPTWNCCKYSDKTENEICGNQRNDKFCFRLHTFCQGIVLPFYPPSQCRFLLW